MVTSGSIHENGNVSLNLAGFRLKKRLSLEEISEATKIGVRSLRAIEAGDFHKLPGGIYNTSYIRQYAKAIEFDESEILAAYHSVMGIAPEGDDNPQQPDSSNQGFFTRFLRHTSTVLGSL